MITKAIIVPVLGGYELHFAERYPYKERDEISWKDFKTTKEDARQIAQEAHSFHIINLVTDLVEELSQLDSPILEPLKNAMQSVLDECTANYTPNHRQLCRSIAQHWQYMSLVTADKAKLIVLELQDTVNYEMSTETKKWILE